MSTNVTMPSSGEGFPAARPDHVVGIGASAGGLEALSAFAASLTGSPATAYVIAQHLSPSHASLLVELLGRATAIPVVQAHDGAVIQGGVIVVAPPNHDVTVEGDILRVHVAPERFGSSPSIDLLFDSLARSWGARSVAVVLSGTGSDGALGMRAVRAAGGLCLVQTPETAQFEGMPRAAIALGGAELVADADELGSRVSGLAQSVEKPPAATEGEPEVLLEALQTRLKAIVGIDFDRYKRSTVWRQVHRRMSIREIPDLAAYVELIAEDPNECHALASSLLVSVTSFFRDPEAFAALSQRIREYIEATGATSLRVWVPGCATGEEAYSVGMLVGEALGFPADLARRLKVFGTDLDEAALGIARRGVYPLGALEAVPEGLRERYTRPAPDGFRISDILRECTVFAQQDVGHDPPFPQVDIISCRNTLIYFNESLQRDVVRLFAFALKPGGILFLGKAESVSSATSFVAVDSDRRIFQRSTEGVLPALHASRATPRPRGPLAKRVDDQAALRGDGSAEQVALLEAILRARGDSFLVLDSQQQLVYVVGDVSTFCQVPQGHLSSSAGSFLKPEFQAEARALMLLSNGGRHAVDGQFIHLDGESTYQMSVLPAPVGEATYIVLTLRAVAGEPDSAQPASHERSQDFDRELQRLDRELQASQEVLRRSMTELQAANQELEATSEELQSSLEELQSANEELQASNEELEATNEELATANEAQRARSEELERANLDLRNIQTAASEGMVVLDRALCVKRYTPMAIRVFSLTPADLGRPLADVPTSLPIPDLEAPLRRVVDESSSEAVEVSSSSGHYLLRLMPYVGGDGSCIGAIVTLTDVSQLVALRDEAEDALEQLEAKTLLLRRQATVDEVTDVSNRAHFTEALDRELDRCSRTHDRLALAWIDLDRFKEVNDGLGHEAGDITLHVCADRLRRLIRGTDVLGRLGGDEFGIVLSGPDNLGDLDTVLERIVASFHEPIAVPNGEARVSASIGVAVFPDDATSGRALLRAADAAMYAVKAIGGDGFAYYDQSMNERADQRRIQRYELDAGIAAKEFELYFQPIVSVHNDAVWGVEALLRWAHQGRVRPAGEFVPFAETSGQIRQLSEVTMRGARAASAAIGEAGFEHLCMAINFSVTQLADPVIVDLINSWPVPDSLSGLVIEVLESVFLPDHRNALETLRLFAAMGARISVDDFGSGYSNYRLLESLSPALIKLDKSYLGAGRAPEARAALMESAIQMAHAVEARVIVEGVESADDLALAQASGADLVQGYLVAPPMPLSELVPWLDERRDSDRMGRAGC